MTEAILVTGATGTVGREVVKQLAAGGARVRAAARRYNRLYRGVSGVGSLEFVEMDFDRPQTVDAAFAGVRRVFLLTPLEERMVEIASTLLTAAKAAGVRHIVRLSAMGADGEPRTRLGRVHGAVEALIADSGLAYTFLRPNAFMQNYLTYFGDAIRTQNAFYMPQGEGRVSLIDARDIAAVAAVAITGTGHQGKAYELTGPAALDNHEVAEILSQATERRIVYEDVPEQAARDAMVVQGTPTWLIEVIMELYAISRAGDAARVSHAVKDVLGREAMSFRQFARDYAEELR